MHQAERELLQTMRDFYSCKQEEGQFVSSYVLKMKSYIDNLERLCHPVSLNLGDLKRSRKLKPGALSLYVANGQRAAVEAIGSFHLFSRNNMVYFSVVPNDGIFEINLSNSNTNDSSMYAEHELEDLGEPVNYKAALLDPEFDKWRNAMNVEIQSMKDNGVWDLVDLPPNGKIVGSKLLFKKKTDMDGSVHTYKARLVAKGFTQTYRVDYEETFSSVADIRAIRILIAIAAYYDYEIWKIDVKTAFLNGHLSEEVYMEQPEDNIPMLQDVKSYLRRYFAMKDLREVAYLLGIKINKDRSRRLIAVCQSTYIKKILKRFHMENSKRGKCAICLSCGFYYVCCEMYLPWNTKDMFLVYGGDIKRELKVSCYIDVGYLTDADDLKSQTGYVFALNGGAEAVWIRKFISGLGVVPTIKEPIKMHCDNIQTIVISNESGITKGARHFRAKVDYLREVIDYGDIKLEKVHTYDNDNLADPFTKASAFPKHSEHTKNIGMLPASSLM
nr:hypothetical protein [Tanacetum cinerariifolium]